MAVVGLKGSSDEWMDKQRGLKGSRTRGQLTIYCMLQPVQHGAVQVQSFDRIRQSAQSASASKPTFPSEPCDHGATSSVSLLTKICGWSTCHPHALNSGRKVQARMKAVPWSMSSLPPGTVDIQGVTERRIVLLHPNRQNSCLNLDRSAAIPGSLTRTALASVSL